MAEQKKIQIHLSGTIEIDQERAVKLCNELLAGIAESDAIEGGTERKRLRDLMIQILEEKYGINVKQCETCESCAVPTGHTSLIFSRCEYWTPKEKEVPEKQLLPQATSGRHGGA